MGENLLRVQPIRNGTVIDHIKAGRGKKVLDILGLSGSETTISLLINVQSKIQKRKDRERRVKRTRNIRSNNISKKETDESAVELDTDDKGNIKFGDSSA